MKKYTAGGLFPQGGIVIGLALLISKEKVHQLYKKCHFIILPSKTEGFPKVIGEAMNYGCIPIVSDISCISQYIQNEVNGYVLEKNTEQGLKEAVLNSLSLSNEKYKGFSHTNYTLAQKFTYSHYQNRMVRELFTGLRQIKN